MMVRKSIIAAFFFIFALSIPSSVASDIWLFNTDQMVIDVNISSNISLVKPSPTGRVEYVQANITFFPRAGSGQEVISDRASPTPIEKNGGIVFRWENPPQNDFDFSIASRVKTTNRHFQINSRVNFPISKVPEDAQRFLYSSSLIDINKQMTSVASELVAGENDLFVVVDRIASWVNANVQYDLTTVTAEAAQKASWVMDNRKGVCDEITSLFIAMLRSIGIPARFVSGISYTNSPLFTNKWGPHGWAEVYFPDYGWVPFDVTYGEYGWIDPSHVVTAITEDASRSTAFYSWRAESGVSLDINKLSINVPRAVPGKQRPSMVGLSISALYPEVRFGSSNIITATAKNLNGYYLSIDVYLSRTKGMEVVTPLKQHLLLPPGAVSQLSWLVNVDKGMDHDYIYTLPVAAYLLDNTTAATAFMTNSDAPFFSPEEVKATYDKVTLPKPREYSRTIDISCASDKSLYYTYEEASVTCFLSNKGNIPLEDLSVCVKDDCKKQRVGISQTSNVTFSLGKAESGSRNIAASVSGQGIAQHTLFILSVLDAPAITISDILAPESVSYRENYPVRFLLRKDSSSLPRNVSLKFGFAGAEKHFFIDQINQSMPYSVYASGADLEIGNNSFIISLEYSDLNGKKYSSEEHVTISLSEISYWQRFLIFLRHIGVSLFSKSG
ncbi:MAG TPA: transglutaminase-like domain-containing protein [Candidatus Nanoarchaeia archaeon]|nr:transglutaminase-like domain-containing protein [Candidatus Nanoarchaeia archaeon]